MCRVLGVLGTQSRDDFHQRCYRSTVRNTHCYANSTGQFSQQYFCSKMQRNLEAAADSSTQSWASQSTSLLVYDSHETRLITTM